MLHPNAALLYLAKAKLTALALGQLAASHPLCLLNLDHHVEA
jgi:hypothetical protein